MAINSEEITTVRVDQLANVGLTLESLFPHTVGTELTSSSIQDLATLVATTIETLNGFGFLPVSVTDGQTLPAIPTNPSFILVGAGTYTNLNGFPDIICTENLNALMTLTDHWEIAVEIPINPLTGSVQSVTGSAVDNTDPLNPVINLSAGGVTSVNGDTGVVVVDLQSATDVGNTITDGTDTTAISANGLIVSDGTDSFLLNKTSASFNDGTVGAYYGKVFAEITDGTNGITIDPTGITVNGSQYLDDKITVGGVDYPLPTGTSSQIATLADITVGVGYTVVNANLTASNDANYTVVANATFTDPSPTEGKGYVVYVRNGTATIGGTGYAVGSLVFRVFHSGAWSTREYKSNLTASDIPSGIDAVKIADGSVSNTEFKYLDGVTSNIQTQLNNRVGYHFKNTTQTVVTGTTSETIIYAEEVSANSISNNTILSFRSRNYRNPRVGTCIYKLYINTVNNLTGSPVQIGRLDVSANQGSNPFERDYLIKDNILSGFQFNAAVVTDLTAANVTQGTTTYNINTTYYWILTAQPNTSTDSLTHSFSILERI